MKSYVCAILIAAVFAEETNSEVSREAKKDDKKKESHMIEASTKDTVNDCLFIERTHQGAMKRQNEDGTPNTCWGMYFNLCDDLLLMPTTSCTIMTY